MGENHFLKVARGILKRLRTEPCMNRSELYGFCEYSPFVLSIEQYLMKYPYFIVELEEWELIEVTFLDRGFY